MLLVSDLMTHSVVTLTPEMSLAQATSTLATMDVSGAPVCDAEGRAVGVFSKSDIIKLDGSVRPAATVGELMTAAVVAIRPSDPIASAIDLMARRGVHRLMVVDEDGAVAGILTPMDIVKAVASGKLPVQGDELPR